MGDINTGNDKVIFVTGGYDHTIKIWQAHTGICQRTLQHTDSQVNALAITPNKHIIAAAGYEHIRMYDVHSNNPTPVISYEGVSKNISGLGFQMPSENSMEYFSNISTKWYHKITVEPVMWLYMMAYMITSVIEQAFFLYKSCRVDHKYSEEICSNLSQHKNITKEVQVSVSEFHQWNNIAAHIVPIILALFMGNWSDRYGRKAPLILGLIGKLIYSFMVVVNSLMSDWNLNMIIYTASIPMGLLGGDISIFASCFAYISDISSIKERTLRVTLLDVVYLSAMPTGVAVGSLLFYDVSNRSYTIMFMINATMLLIALIYSLYFLKWQTTSNQARFTWTNMFYNFFDKHHILATINTLLKRRMFQERLCLWMLLLCMILYTFQRDEKPMSYLYTQLKFNWGITEFSQFRTYYSSLFVLAMLITVPIMNKFILLADTSVIMIGVLSHAIGRVFFAIANVWQIFYLGAVVAAFGPIAAPALRSIVSKIVTPEERGKMFSILSVCDNAVPLFSSTLYSQLYNATIHTSPNQIFWLTFASQLCVFLLVMIVHFSILSKNMQLKQCENKK